MTSTNGSKTKLLAPSKLAHVVLRTNKFDKMKEYYKTFLGGHATYENDMLCFVTYDDEHHRIALMNMPHLAEVSDEANGFEHMAFTYDTLQDLCTSYRQKKALGITPGWCVNHGPSTSMYYKDLDGNTLETQVDNFDTSEEATDFMMSQAFADNALGVDFDPEDLCRRVDAGEDDASIKTRPNIGTRSLEDVPKITAMMKTSKTGF